MSAAVEPGMEVLHVYEPEMKVVFVTTLFLRICYTRGILLMLRLFDDYYYSFVATINLSRNDGWRMVVAGCE